MSVKTKARAGAGDLIRRSLAPRAADALFGLGDALPRLVEAALDEIAPHPEQPRKAMNPQALEGLAASIERHGLLQPIVVRVADGAPSEREGYARPRSGRPAAEPGWPGDAAESSGSDVRTPRYVLVAGQRRLEALRLLGRTTAPALIADGRADELALIENLQREALDPIDEAEALAALKARHGYTLDELALAVGKAKSTVSEVLAIGNLPDAIKRDLRPPADAQGHRVVAAKAVLVEVARAGGEAEQLALWQELRGGATVREARAARAGAGEGGEPTPKRAAPAPGRLAARKAKALNKALAALDPGELDDDARESLEALSERLDELLA